MKLMWPFVYKHWVGFEVLVELKVLAEAEALKGDEMKVMKVV